MPRKEWLLKSLVSLGASMQEMKEAESGPEGKGQPATRYSG